MLWRTLWKGSLYLVDSWGLWPRYDATMDVITGGLEAKKKGKVGSNIAWAMRMALRKNNLIDHPDSLNYETSPIISGMIDGCRFHTGLEGKAVNEMMNAVDVGNEDRALEIQGALWEFENSDNPYSSNALTIHEPVEDTSLDDRLTEIYGHQAYKAIAASKFNGGWHTETDLNVKADQLHQADLMRDNVRELPSKGLELPDDMQRDDYPVPLPEEYQPTEADVRQLAKEMAVPMGKEWAPWHEEDEIFDILTTHISFQEHQVRTKSRIKEGCYNAHNRAKKIGPIKVKALKEWGITDGRRAYRWGDLAALGSHTKTLVHIPGDRLDSFIEQASQLPLAKDALEYLQ